MGNPTSYRGATATWFGRQLRSYTKGSTSVSYRYDENGLRTQKTVNGVVHDYYYVGDRLVYEKLGDEDEYFYCYDADGRLAMVERVIISSGAKGYFFTITNAQGDVIGIRSTTGAVIARYSYDAFGKLISTTDNSGNTLPSYSFAYQISVRYRGYYYDSETGLYYLQSRYYDPEVGRFINCDDVHYIGLIKSSLSYNSFAYCWNCPIMFADYFGFIGWPGAIHKQVILKIKEKNPGLEISKTKIVYANGKYGYCDIIDPITGYVWEVKRQTVSKEKAVKQLIKYVNGTYYHNKKLKMKIGKRIKGGSFECDNSFTHYYVSYWYAGDGIIYYDYNKKSNLVPDPVVMEQLAYAAAAYYVILTVITILTGGATAPGYLIPVL